MSDEDRSSPLFLASFASRLTAPDRPVSRSTPSFHKELKVIVVGSSGVGKTSLVRREAFGEFEPDAKLTLGTERLTTRVELHDDVIELALYDTVGQERFMTISTTLYRNAQAVLICFDCSNRASFDAVTRWYADVERNAPQDALILLIVTKTDLPRAVSAEECRQKAAEMGIHLVETSAKTGQNVKALFALVANALAGEKGLRTQSTLVPALSAPPSPMMGPTHHPIRIERPASSPAAIRKSHDPGALANGLQLPPPPRGRRRDSSIGEIGSTGGKTPSRSESACWTGMSLRALFAATEDASSGASPFLKGASASSPHAGPTMIPIPTPDDGLSLAEVLVEHASLRARTLAGGLRRRNTVDQPFAETRHHAASSVADSGSVINAEDSIGVSAGSLVRHTSLKTTTAIDEDDEEGFRVCSLGCGAVLEKFRTNHETEECWLRLVPCSLGCGRSFPMLDCVAHERESCKLRSVRCPCGAKFKAEDLVDHSTTFRPKSISLWGPEDVVHFALSVFPLEKQRKRINFARVLQERMDGKQLLWQSRQLALSDGKEGREDLKLVATVFPDTDMRKNLDEALRNFSFVASSSSSLSKGFTPESPTQQPSVISSALFSSPSRPSHLQFPHSFSAAQPSIEYSDWVPTPQGGDEPSYSVYGQQQEMPEPSFRNPAMIEPDQRTRTLLTLGIVSSQRRQQMLAPRSMLLNNYNNARTGSSPKLSDGDEAAGATTSRIEEDKPLQRPNNVLVEDLDSLEEGEDTALDNKHQRCPHGTSRSSCPTCSSINGSSSSSSALEFAQTWSIWLRESQETKRRRESADFGSDGIHVEEEEEDATREVLVPLSLGSRVVAVRTLRFADLQLMSQDLVGSGSFGSVYFGRYRGAQVAVKHLHYQDIAERDLLREAAVMTSVSGHPHVLRFLGVCLERPNICFVSEALQCSLEDWLRYDRMNHAEPLSEILRFAEEAASGVYHLHLEMVVHRDIAARNLLFDSGNPRRVKVCDFGLARVLPRRNHVADGGSSALSNTHQPQFAVLTGNVGGGGSLNLAGPLRWMSPESLRPAGDGLTRFSFASDVYSFAITLWELLSRDVPYSSLQPHEVAIAVLMENLRPPRAKMPSFVVEQLHRLLDQASSKKCVLQLVALLERAWDKDSSQRPTMREVVNELSSLRMICTQERREEVI